MAPDLTDESQDGHTLLDGERQVLEMIATGSPLAAVLEALCRAIDRRSGLHSSIFLVDADGAHLRLMAGPHLPEIWRQAVRVIPSTATACGAAVTRRAQVVSPDMLSDPLYYDYREAAQAAGLRAVWSTPFLSKDRRALGTFAVYSEHPGGPTDTNNLTTLPHRLRNISTPPLRSLQIIITFLYFLILFQAPPQHQKTESPSLQATQACDTINLQFLQYIVAYQDTVQQ